MKYYVIPSAEKLSEYYLDLILPPNIRSASNITTSVFSILTHPISSKTALEIPDDASLNEFRIHPSVDDGNIDIVTERLENQGILNAAEKALLRNKIKGNKGKKIKAMDLIPNQYKAKDYDEMKLDGWFEGL
jgi:hypothetical protein